VRKLERHARRSLRQRSKFGPSGRLDLAHGGLLPSTIVKIWQVVAVLALPFLDVRQCCAFAIQMIACHLIGGIHEEKKNKRDDVDPNDNGNGIEQPPQNVGTHPSALLRCRRRIPAQAGTITPSSTGANTMTGR